jgi:chromodomain-helicase-DNA-binding protein 1
MHPPSNSEPPLPLSNGHLSPQVQPGSTADDRLPSSGSDLSDAAQNAPAATASPADQPANVQPSVGDVEMSESMDEDAEGSEDAEYDLDSIPPDQHTSEPEQPSSAESAQSAKRKAPDDSDVIQQNPELYGLRRSVSCCSAAIQRLPS